MLHLFSLALVGLSLLLPGCSTFQAAERGKLADTPPSPMPPQATAPSAPSVNEVVPATSLLPLPPPLPLDAAPTLHVPHTEGSGSSLASSSYTVASGETLWSIAARRYVYADALLWPLLYRANRDQIKDPRQVYPGQVLRIPRNPSAAELGEARTAARNSAVFPVESIIPAATSVSH